MKFRSLSTPEKAQRRVSEEALWQSWVDSGKHPTKLRPLLKSLEPLVQKSVNTYRAADVSHHALRAQAENQLISGLGSYKPSKGSLSTHLNWQMRGVGRFVEKYQNISKIPGNRIRFVGKYQTAKAGLEADLGRAPTLEELAKRSKLSRKTVGKLQDELKPVHLFGLMVDETGAPLSDFESHVINPDRERVELIYHDLTPQEQLLVDHSFGRGGKKLVTSTNTLASMLGVSAARISNLRASIAKKAKAIDWIR